MVLPARNEADLEDVPEPVRQRTIFHLAGDVSEVLAAALVAPGALSLER